jgi:hypothetical protein
MSVALEAERERSNALAARVAEIVDLVRIYDTEVQPILDGLAERETAPSELIPGSPQYGTYAEPWIPRSRARHDESEARAPSSTSAAPRTAPSAPGLAPRLLATRSVRLVIGEEG